MVMTVRRPGSTLPGVGLPAIAGSSCQMVTGTPSIRGLRLQPLMTRLLAAKLQKLAILGPSEMCGVVSPGWETSLWTTLTRWLQTRVLVTMRMSRLVTTFMSRVITTSRTVHRYMP